MQRFIAWVVRRSRLVIALTALATLGLLAQLRSLTVIIDPDATLPQTHPYIATGNLIEKTFGNKLTVVIGVTATEGTVFKTPVLEKVKRITERLEASPLAVKSNITSLASRKSKNIIGDAEGMTVRPLMAKVPTTTAEMDELRAGLKRNPVYGGLLIADDERTTQIVAEFKKAPGGFLEIAAAVEAAVAPERDQTVRIDVSGLTIFLALLEKYSARMAFLFPLALLIIGLIHYEAFRTVQALVLPLVTALLAVVWAIGILGLIGEPFDVFNSSTPILILAIAAGHAVQILKRYYEEFAAVDAAHPSLLPRQKSERAIVSSLTKVGPVMVVACTVAALGFFSLVIFEIKSIRTFGIFTGAGVLSALILELTFIPALRMLLPPPTARELSRERKDTFWDRLTAWFFHVATERRKGVYVVVGALVALLSLGGYWLKIDNSQKGYFYGDVPERLADDALNARMAGTNPFYVLVEGPGEDAIKRPDVMRAMEQLQAHIEKQPDIGKAVSIVDFIKKMNQSMNADAPDAYVLPDSQDLIAQYLFLYSNSGDPGDFDSYVDYGYQRAVITAFAKTDRSSSMQALADEAVSFAKETFPKDIVVRVGGGSLGGVALNEIMIREKALNIAQIMGAVFLVSAIVFRSVLAGLLILVPLLAAVLVNFGVMGLLGIPLQIATALVSAMAVGIGADYGIYMSYRMREELRSGAPEDVAIKRAFKSAGKAALFVSTAVAGGFGVLMLSVGFMIHVWMGFLIALAMLVSSVTALTLFPALIFSLRPKFIFSNGKDSSMLRTAAALSLVAAATGASLGLFAPRAEAQTLTAPEIAAKSYAATKVADSKTDSTFRLINAEGKERVRETTGATKLVPGTSDNMRLVTFLSPSDVKGTKTLLVEQSGKEDNIWIYLPAMKKVRRLVASNKKDAFVGTDFTYGDVIGHRPEDWSHKLLREEKVDGKDCYVIESLPAKPEIGETSGYTKRVGWVDKESFVALKGEGYDQQGKLARKFKAQDVKKVDDKANKWQPMRIEAENVETGHRTVIEFKNYVANAGVSDELFTTRHLEK